MKPLSPLRPLKPLPPFGFTLIELMVVLGLVGVLVSVIAIFSVKIIAVRELERVREIVTSELGSAQANAIAGTNDASAGVAFFSHSITRFQGSSYASRNQSFDKNNVFSNNVTFSGPSEIVFTRPEGVPQTASTITITHNSNSATIIISAAGAISVQ